MARNYAPVEKAKDLYDKMYALQSHQSIAICRSVAQKSALLFAEEMFSESKVAIQKDAYAMWYWQGVIAEIKLIKI